MKTTAEPIPENAKGFPGCEMDKTSRKANNCSLPKLNDYRQTSGPRKNSTMPLHDLSAVAVGRSFASNSAARWHAKAGDSANCESTALSRLNRPTFYPHLGRGFPIHADDHVFAIGSCFARGVERALVDRGFHVDSAAPEFNSFAVTAPGSSALGLTNKYNPPSILNEMGWALDPLATFPSEALIRLDEKRWVDPHTNPVLEVVDREQTLERRRNLIDVTRRIARCRVVIITLGLIEAWLDLDTGLYLNSAPPAEVRNSDRFRFHVLDYMQVRDTLARISRLLAAHGHPEVQIIVTVSPIPLAVTFTDQDVVLANTHSKCLLRAAAEEWSASHDNVHYFPSYEIVMNSERGVAWEADGRHVRGELVKHIMNVFASTFFDQKAIATAGVAK